MRRRGLAALATLVLAVGSLGGCLLPGDPTNEGAAIERTAEAFRLRFIRCGEYRLSQVKVQEVPPGEVVVRDDAPVVWHITLETPRAWDVVTIGVAPAGARELVPLTGPLRKERYLVSVEFADRHMSLGLRPSELKEGSIEYRERTYSPEEFERLATQC